MRKLVTALLIFSAVAAGCADDPPRFGSAREVADVIGCTDLETRRAERVEETGVCDIDEGRVTIFTFRDEKQRDDWLRFGARFSEDLIIGPDWALDPPADRAQEIREALT